MVVRVGGVVGAAHGGCLMPVTVVSPPKLKIVRVAIR
jgi:hypothetical protein